MKFSLALLCLPVLTSSFDVKHPSNLRFEAVEEKEEDERNLKYSVQSAYKPKSPYPSSYPSPEPSSYPSFTPNAPMSITVNATDGMNFFRKDCEHVEAGDDVEIHRDETKPKERYFKVDCYDKFGLDHDSLACWILGLGELENVCEDDKFMDCELSGTSNEGKFTTVSCMATIAAYDETKNCTGPIKPRIQALCC